MKPTINWKCEKCGKLNREVLEFSSNDGEHNLYISADYDRCNDLISFDIDLTCPHCGKTMTIEIEN